MPTMRPSSPGSTPFSQPPSLSGVSGVGTIIAMSSSYHQRVSNLAVTRHANNDEKSLLHKAFSCLELWAESNAAALTEPQRVPTRDCELVQRVVHVGHDLTLTWHRRPGMVQVAEDRANQVGLILCELEHDLPVRR